MTDKTIQTATSYKNQQTLLFCMQAFLNWRSHVEEHAKVLFGGIDPSTEEAALIKTERATRGEERAGFPVRQD